MRQGWHHVAKKLTNIFSLPNSLAEINLSFFNNDSVSNFGIFLSNKLDGSSDGFLSIVKR